MIPRPQRLRSWLARDSRARFWVAWLAVSLTVLAGPLGCRLLCAEDCCSEDSDCPICIVARTQATSPAEPEIVLAPPSLPPLSRPLTNLEPRPAGDHRLLPSRAPPRDSLSLLIH